MRAVQLSRQALQLAAPKPCVRQRCTAGPGCQSRGWLVTSNSLSHRANHTGSTSPDVVPLEVMRQPMRWAASDVSAPNCSLIQGLPAAKQLQQRQYYEPAPNQQTVHAFQLTASATQPHAKEATRAAKDLTHIHVPFLALFAYMSVLAVSATSSDWYLDIGCFGAIWAGLWALCCRLQPSPRTVVLLNLLPLCHMTGALGTYHWELGNLSYDILVHISNGFIGTLLFAACMADMTAAAAATTAAAAAALDDQAGTAGSPAEQLAAQLHHAADAAAAHDDVAWTADAAVPTHPHSAATAPSSQWKSTVLTVLKLSGMLLIGTTLIEVLEAYGGQLAGQGEGIFLRGAGDFCTASLPCSEEVDTAKDMVDNITGMLLALVALATTGRSGSSSARA